MPASHERCSISIFSFVISSSMTLLFSRFHITLSFDAAASAISRSALLAQLLT